MVAITHIGTARSQWVQDGHSALGPDEDGFTLVAAAAEAALVDGGSNRAPLSIELVGGVPEVADWALPLLLGTDERPMRTRSIGESLRRHRNLASGARSLVVELGEGAGTGPEGFDSAIAVLFESQPGWEVQVVSSDEGSVHGRTLEILEAIRGAAAGERATVIEQGGMRVRETAPVHWHPAEAAGSALSGARPVARPGGEPSLARVSEGAYIPRARYLESIPARWRFEADACSSCGRRTFPARGACAGCGRRDGLVSVRLPLNGGRVVALTTIGKGGQPTEFDPWVEAVGSYPVAIVELASGARATLQVSDWAPGSLKIGDPVSTRLRRLYPMDGEWRYGRKAVPLVAGD